MNQIEFSFETPGWELAMQGLQRGSTLSAAQFLAMMESEPDDALVDALTLLEQKNILPDISSLPEDFGNGESALRLRREKELVKSGSLMDKLEENDPLRLYLEEVDNLTGHEEILDLSGKLCAGDGNVVPELVNGLLGRVIELSYTYVGKGVLLLDLIQEGSLGLWQGLTEEFEGDFLSYCDRKIQFAMSKTVILQARQSGIGKKLRQAMEDYRDMDRQLLTELGRNPTEAEIAEKLHVTLDEVITMKEMLDSARILGDAAASIEQTSDTQDDLAVEDTAYFQMRQRIEELLSVLSETDGKILSLRFGLDGKAPMSPEDTGRRLGLTPEEVMEKEAAALTLLRNTTQK